MTGMAPSSWTWVEAEGGQKPRYAVFAGTDLWGDVYVARGYYENQLIPGKVVAELECAAFAWDGKEVGTSTYEVLIAPPGSLEWELARDGNVPHNAIPAGYEEKDGNYDILYIGRVIINGYVACGKVHPSHQKCYVAWGGREQGFTSYEVLVENLDYEPPEEMPQAFTTRPSQIESNRRNNNNASEPIRRQDSTDSTRRTTANPSEAARRLNRSESTRGTNNEATQRANPTETTRRTNTDSAQRSNPTETTRRTNTDSAQRSNPTDTTSRTNSDTAQRSNPTDTSRRTNTDSAQRSYPTDSTRRTNTDTAQRSTPTDTTRRTNTGTTQGGIPININRTNSVDSSRNGNPTETPRRPPIDTTRRTNSIDSSRSTNPLDSSRSRTNLDSYRRPPTASESRRTTTAPESLRRSASTTRPNPTEYTRRSVAPESSVTSTTRPNPSEYTRRSIAPESSSVISTPRNPRTPVTIVPVAPTPAAANDDEISDKICCKICFERPIQIVFNCGHGACRHCADQLRTCHTCRGAITARIRFYELE